MMPSQHIHIGAISALVIAHCAGMLDLVALPVWVGALVERYGFAPREAGLLATLFLTGAVLASVLIAPNFVRLRHRPLAAGGFALAALAFALAAMRRDFATLAVLHLAAGVMVGTGLSLVHGAMGRSHAPHRVFAISGIGLGLFAILILAGLPQLLIHRGDGALFTTFAVAMAIAALACALGFPNIAPERIESATRARFSPAVWYVIAGIAAMTLNQAMVFSFVEVIGKARGFAHEAVLGVLAALGLINFLLAAPLAMALEKRLNAQRVVLIGPLIQGALALVIATAGQFPLWAPAAAVFVAVQIFTHTFAFGLLARLDPSGRATCATPAMLMAGSALGPLVGGVLGQRFGFAALGVAAVIVALAAMCLFHRSNSLPSPPPRSFT